MDDRHQRWIFEKAKVSPASAILNLSMDRKLKVRAELCQQY